MISNIKKIKNVGKYEMFCGTELFEKNTMIFGFNGAGKSTLSDIFYSLASKEKDGIIAQRRTLNRPNEHGLKEIEVILSDEFGNDIIFSDDTWNNVPPNMHVFNNYYIEDHVFVSKHLQGNAIPIGMGAEGTKYMKQRETLIDANKKLISKINDNITLLGSAGYKIKDFSNQRVTEKTKIKRFENMASFTLYSVNEKKVIEEKIKNNTKYTKELADIETCENLYQGIREVSPIDITILMKKVKKTVRISSKEIAKFLSESLTTVDIKWAVKGYRNQKDTSKCPMCGQTIAEKRAILLFDKLGKYISQNKDENIRIFCSELHLIVGKLKMLDLENKVIVMKQIIDILNANFLLLKRDIQRLEKGLEWGKQENYILQGVIQKIYDKAENPYIEINLSDEEEKCILSINQVIRNIRRLSDIIQQVKERLEKKIEKTISMDDMNVIYALSYGNNRNIAEQIRDDSSIYIRNEKKISELNEKIDDCYNQIKLDEINGYLSKLNTHIAIEVIKNKYYVRLKDFEAKEYEKGKEMFFSEGESRAVAFAYFLAEVNSTENKDVNSIIIIDDPICSMDLNRKSIISYQISEMMKNTQWQVIIMTHDISFVERIEGFLSRGISCKKLDLRSEKNDFLLLDIKDYLTDDTHVYEEFIRDAEKEDDELVRIVALMSMRPYASVKKVSERDYKDIEKKATYFSHTLYSKKENMKFKKEDYDCARIKEYVDLISVKTGLHIDSEKIVSGYSFDGFDFNKISTLYTNIPLDSMKNARKKVLLMRLLIEACFFQLSKKDSFNFGKIGYVYNQVIKENKDDADKYRMCKALKEIYDSSKKYHHGADDGSLLGIAWINPNEIEYYDKVLNDIIANIKTNYTVRTLIA